MNKHKIIISIKNCKYQQASMLKKLFSDKVLNTMANKNNEFQKYIKLFFYQTILRKFQTVKIIIIRFLLFK